MRDLFLQCTCVYMCRSRSGMSICAHLHSRARNSCVTCTVDEAHVGGARDRQGITAFLGNGERGGQRGWSSATYVFCGVEC